MSKEWAILCWYPRGAYWYQCRDNDGRTRVVTFSTQIAAMEVVNRLFDPTMEFGGYEVLEYNR